VNDGSIFYDALIISGIKIGAYNKPIFIKAETSGKTLTNHLRIIFKIKI
jgi:hypothetical protein